MEISDLIVFVVALGIAVAGGVVTIMEMLKGGKNELESFNNQVRDDEREVAHDPERRVFETCYSGGQRIPDCLRE